MPVVVVGLYVTSCLTLCSVRRCSRAEGRPLQVNSQFPGQMMKMFSIRPLHSDGPQPSALVKTLYALVQMLCALVQILCALVQILRALVQIRPTWLVYATLLGGLLQTLLAWSYVRSVAIVQYVARVKTSCLSFGFVVLFEPFIFVCYEHLYLRVLETFSFQSIRLVKTYVVSL